MKRQPLAALLLIFGLFALCGCGSQSPMVKVQALRQTYTASLDGLTTAINAGQIRDRETLLTIRDVIRPEIEAGLDDAETKAVAGDKIGANFVLSRVESLLERLLVIKSKARPATRPVSLKPENPAWKSQPSLNYLSALRRSFQSWERPLARSTLAVS